MRVAGAAALALLTPLVAAAGPATSTPLLEVAATSGATSAVVRWHAPPGAGVTVEYGRDHRLGLWAPPAAAGTATTVLTGLEPATPYDYRVTVDAGGRRARADGSFTTRALGDVRAEIRSGTLVVNAKPIFPRMVFRSCVSAITADLLAGINLFMGACDGREGDFVRALAGRAFAVPNIVGRADGRGVIGWHLLDEADLYVRPRSLPLLPASAKGRRVTFLTLTSHFWAGAAPGPLPRELYPEMVARAGVIGFTAYPLTSWCRRAFGAVLGAQQALVSLAAGKPTYQWIEAAPMGDSRCYRNGRFTPTAGTVRAEVWLAIVGGAKGIGYFPYDWPPDVRTEVVSINQEIAALAPALLSPLIPPLTSSGTAPVKATARAYNGATYVIAVNSTGRAHVGRFALPDLKQAASLSLWGEGRSVEVGSGGKVVDTFAPFAVHVYIAAPVPAGT